MENNKLIAEFMGYEIRPKLAISPEGNKYFLNPEGRHTTHRLLFHSSWDWLMPVAKKCVSIAYDLSVPYPETEKWLETIKEVIGQLDINDLYGVVVEFIKWYNKKESGNE